MTTPDPTLRERIGGRWAVSRMGYGILITIATFSTILLEPRDQRSWSSEGGAILCVLAFAAVAAVIFWIADRTVFRSRRIRPVPVWSVAAFGVVLSFSRLVILLWVAPSLGFAQTNNPGVRLVVASVAGALLYPLVVLLLDVVDRTRAEQHALMTRLVDTRSLEAEREGLVESITDRVYAEVLRATERARADLPASPGALTSDERLQVAERLRGTVVDSLRPLSQRLYASSTTPIPDISMMAALRQALRRQPLEPVAAGVFVGLFSTPAVIASGSQAWAFPLLAASAGLTVYLGLVLVRWLARRIEWVRRRALAAGVVVAGLFMCGRLGIGDVVRGEFSPGWLAGAVFFVAFFVLLTSFVGALIRGEREVTAELTRAVDERAIDAAVANRELARVSRDIAQHVHGTLQSQLLATAFAVEQATARGDDAAATSAIESARRALEADPAARAAEMSLDAEVRARVSLWHGFMPIEAFVDPSIGALAPGVIADVGRIVEEGIGNAHKHGGQIRVRVRVEAANDAVRVRVIDDGPGPAGGVPGIGFTWLDFVAPGAWTLSPAAGGGSELRVDLPRAPAGHGHGDRSGHASPVLS